MTNYHEDEGDRGTPTGGNTSGPAPTTGAGGQEMNTSPGISY